MSCTLIDAKASVNAASKSGKVRGLSERRRAFTFDQPFSIGLITQPSQDEVIDLLARTATADPSPVLRLAAIEE